MPQPPCVLPLPLPLLPRKASEGVRDEREEEARGDERKKLEKESQRRSGCEREQE